MQGIGRAWSARLPGALLAALFAMLLAHSGAAQAQNFDFHPPASAEAATANAIMRDLAERVLPVYLENHRERYLARLSALQAVAGNYAAADETRRQLRERRRSVDSSGVDGAPAEADLFDIYIHARAVEAAQHMAFAAAFTQAYHDGMKQFSDREARVLTTFVTPLPPVMEAAMQEAFDRRRNQSSVSLSDAVELVWTFFSFEAYRSFRVLLPPLDQEDERRRYTVDDDVEIRVGGGTTISAVVVRPNSVTKRSPALLEFALGVAAHGDALDSAAHGYVGIVAYTRGQPKHPTRTVPFQHDGDDARGVIEWIAKQPWSDGRVGMYGDRYSGFTAWAAARKPPAALKAIATADPMVPGIDFPMDGNIFLPTAYRWVLDATNVRTALAGTALSGAEDARWRAVDEAWYKSGEPVGALDEAHGQPSWIYQRLLNHPSYDLFWQLLVPFHEQFARIDLPVLTISGYFADGAAGAMYYVNQLARYNPGADQTVVLGPYDESAIRHGAQPVLAGYRIDPVAMVDLRELRFQWLDHVLKDSPQPALLRDRVNYEVMESNQWRHVPSLAAMAPDSLRLYLDPTGAGQLLEQRRGGDAFLRQTVNLADRSDATWTPPPTIVENALQVHDALVFVGKPLTQPVEVSGFFSGELDLMPNRMDLDLNLTLYELLPSGVYLPLFDPPFEFRASYARDRVHRHLLRAGERQLLPFESDRITGRKLAAGSRLVLVLGVNKRPDREIDFGSGKDVREESAAVDGDPPLKIRWFGGSHIDLPIRK
jgi:putative CocE/NonD family hydrolase